MRPRLLPYVALTSAAAFLGLQLTRANAASTTRLVANVVTHADTAPLVIASKGPTRVTMQNVDFQIAEGVVLRISALDGEMRSVKRDVVDLDDKLSYVLTVDSGNVALTASDLTNLMNHFVFAYPGAPLKNLKVSFRGTSLGLTGTLHKGVNIPFDLTSEVTLTPDVRMRLHPTKIKIFGVNGAVLMKALGINLQKMLDLSKAKGVVVEGNDLLLSPLMVLPPPVIRGRIVSVRVGPRGLEQLFAPARGTPHVDATPPADSSARNYLHFYGGTLHFGKLYMTDAELLIVDTDQDTPFDFDNDHYQRQLVAGHSRTLANLGLEVYMPDAARLSERSAASRSLTSPR
jgi:hypothetical protein